MTGANVQDVSTGMERVADTSGPARYPESTDTNGASSPQAVISRRRASTPRTPPFRCSPDDVLFGLQSPHPRRTSADPGLLRPGRLIDLQRLSGNRRPREVGDRPLTARAPHRLCPL